MNERLRTLSDAGVSIWLDDLPHAWLEDGTLARLIEENSVTGVTTNPTILAASIVGDAPREDDVRALGRVDPGLAIMQLAAADVSRACDLFAGVHRATDGADGWVSIEVEPRLAHDTAGTVEQAVLLHRLVGRDNVLVKIPATPEGLPAITETIARGISVNVTLIFSVDRFRQVVDAYRVGLQRAFANDHDLRRIHLVASFFLSRIDVEVDRRLHELGRDDLAGRAGTANAQVALGALVDAHASPRLARLVEKGAHPARLLWASTGTKNPADPDTKYVSGLVARGVINTMPHATLLAFADHGVVGASIEGTAAKGEAVLREIRMAGVDLPEVYARLEREGVSKFARSWDDLERAVTTIQTTRMEEAR